MNHKHQIQIATPSLGKEEWEALREPIESGWLTQGPKVAAFEKAFAQRHQVKHAIAVTSATTGLHLALAAFVGGVGGGARSKAAGSAQSGHDQNQNQGRHSGFCKVGACHDDFL